MMFRKKTIGESCDVGDGTHSKIKRQDSGVLYLTCRNFKEGRIDKSKVYYISEENFAKYFQNGKKALICPQPGDLIFSIIGTIGEPYLVRPSDHFGISSSVAIVRPHRDRIDPQFLFFWMRGPEFQGALFAIKGGVAQSYVSLEMIRSLPAPIIDLPTQRRIAGILSAYDDLIENNLRRIRILEEMAQSLYREWFVHFRFPGYESIPLIDSTLGPIPQGWEVKNLGDLLTALESGKRPKGGINPSESEIPSIGAENVRGIGRHDFTKEKYVSRAFFERMRNGKIHHGDVLLYKDGAYIGRSTYLRDGFPHAECCVNEHAFILRGTPGMLSQTFLYSWISQGETVGAIRSTNANAAQPGINQKGVSGLNILLPSLELREAFEKFAEPITAEIIALAKRNQTLRETRDLLLPKLLAAS